MPWTLERTAELKQRWAEGQSAQKIADEMGDLTRNAVLGKVHRLGLSETRSTLPPGESVQTRFQKIPAAASSKSAKRIVWTDEMMTLLRQLHTKGKRSKEIAAEISRAFDVNLTEQKVNAKISSLRNRGQLTVETSVETTVSTPRRTKASRPASVAVEVPQSGRARPPVHLPLDSDQEAALAAAAVIEEDAQMLGIMDLTNNTCRWPIGDPASEPFGFCGRPIGVDGKGKRTSYCPEHWAVAHRPSMPRRTRR